MINKIFDSIKPYLIYVPIVSSITGLFKLLSNKEVAAKDLSDREVKHIDSHELAKIAISIIPFIGNFVVIVMDVAEKIFPEEKSVAKEPEIKPGYVLVKDSDINEQFQIEIKAAMIRGVDISRSVVKSELEKEHKAEIKEVEERGLKALAELKDQCISIHKEAIEKIQKEKEALVQEIAELRTKIDSSKVNDSELNKTISEVNARIQALDTELSTKNHSIQQNEIRIKQLEKEKSELINNLSDAVASIKSTQVNVKTATKMAEDAALAEQKRAEEKKAREAKKIAVQATPVSLTEPKKADAPAYVSDAAGLIAIAGGGKR